MKRISWIYVIRQEPIRRKKLIEEKISDIMTWIQEEFWVEGIRETSIKDEFWKTAL